MESAETHLRDGIGRLRAFSGFQEEFDGLYEELRKAVVDIYKNKPDQPLPPHLQQYPVLG